MKVRDWMIPLGFFSIILASVGWIFLPMSLEGLVVNGWTISAFVVFLLLLVESFYFLLIKNNVKDDEENWWGYTLWNKGLALTASFGSLFVLIPLMVVVARKGKIVGLVIIVLLVVYGYLWINKKIAINYSKKKVFVKKKKVCGGCKK